MGWFDLLAVQGTLRSLLQHHSSKSSLLRYSAFFMIKLSHPYMTIGETIALTIQTIVGKVKSLLINTLSRFIIAFLPRSKLILKILQTRLQQCMNQELPDVQAGLRKDRGTSDQIANICWIIEKAKEFQENIYFCFISYPKALVCVDHNKLWKILKEMGVPHHLPASWETCMQLKKQQLELDIEQWTGSKLEKEYAKAVYCHPAHLTSCRVYHAKSWAGWSLSWNQDCQEKYQ